MKKEYIFISIVVILLGIIGFIILNQDKTESSLKTKEDIIKMLDTVYKDIELPSLETMEIDATNTLDVSAYTGLQTNSDIENLIVSLPLMNAQAYEVTIIKTKESADVEKMKEEILENINMNKWVCVSAEKLYITNSENVIIVVMARDEWATPVYNGIKKYLNNQIGKELEKTNSMDDIELPPEIKID